MGVGGYHEMLIDVAVMVDIRKVLGGEDGPR